MIDKQKSFFDDEDNFFNQNFKNRDKKPDAGYQLPFDDFEQDDANQREGRDSQRDLIDGLLDNHEIEPDLRQQNYNNDALSKKWQPEEKAQVSTPLLENSPLNSKALKTLDEQNLQNDPFKQ